jgi:hypothetical protein
LNDLKTIYIFIFLKLELEPLNKMKDDLKKKWKRTLKKIKKWKTTSKKTLNFL